MTGWSQILTLRIAFSYINFIKILKQVLQNKTSGKIRLKTLGQRQMLLLTKSVFTSSLFGILQSPRMCTNTTNKKPLTSVKPNKQK